MRLVIVTLGSYGDTAPYIGLGARLRDAGHEVAIAAQKQFESSILEAGLQFREMPGDIRADLSSEIGQKMHRASSWLQALPATLQLAEKMLAELADGIIAAAEGAEMLLLHRTALLHGFLVAKAMNIPYLVFELFPSGLAKTAEFLPAAFGATSLGSWGNRFVYSLLRRAAGKSKSFVASLEAFQRKLGGLRISTEDFYSRMEAERWPIYHAFSPAVVARPADWREELEIIGYFWPQQSSSWEPDPALADFLESGPAPVFIGFGSLVPGEAERLSELVSAAVRRVGARAIVQSGWGNLAGENTDDVLSIGSVPHSWLFPRVSAVVHAAGAGITAAGLRAGVPAVPVPAMNDQPFWAERLTRLGVSAGSLRFQKLSADKLAALLQRTLTDPAYRNRAQLIGEQIRREDGAGRIVEVVQRTRHLH